MTNRQKLILDNLSFARIIAGRMYKTVGDILEYDEILSCTTIGLMDAIDKYKANCGAKFTTYAYFRMKGVIIDELRKVDYLSRNMRQKVKANLVDNITFVDYDKVKNIIPKDTFEVSEDEIDLQIALKKLSIEEQRVIYYHYYANLTDEEISKRIGIKYRTTLYRRRTAIKKLREYFKE